MSRLPVRVRLTAAFAVAMALVLAGAGLFVYERLRNDLDESVTAGLVVRADAVIAAHSPAAGAAGDGVLRSPREPKEPRTGRWQHEVGAPSDALRPRLLFVEARARGRSAS